MNVLVTVAAGFGWQGVCATLDMPDPGLAAFVLVQDDFDADF